MLSVTNSATVKVMCSTVIVLLEPSDYYGHAPHIYESLEGTFRLQISDFRLQTSEFRLHTSDFRL